MWYGFWQFLGRHRQWSWPILGLVCDIRMWRNRGERCPGWLEHRDMM